MGLCVQWEPSRASKGLGIWGQSLASRHSKCEGSAAALDGWRLLKRGKLLIRQACGLAEQCARLEYLQMPRTVAGHNGTWFPVTSRRCYERGLTTSRRASQVALSLWIS